MLPLHARDASAGRDDLGLIDEALETVRVHFGMPVAYLSRFEGDRTVFRNVSAPGLEDLIKPNDHMALSEVYCPLILKGELPTLIRDTADEPACQALAITKHAPIGSHVSLPVKLSDGTTYGMFCCLSPEPNPTLNDRDLAVMSSFVELVTRQVQNEAEEERDRLRDRHAIETILRDRSFTPVFQPLVRLSDRRTVGHEALVRFAAEAAANTEALFLQAARAGLGLELELATVAGVFDLIPRLEDGLYVSFNASPGLICDPRFSDLLETAPARPLVIEVTEHDRAQDLDALQDRIAAFQDAGHRVAIDDVGAGYSDFQRITQLGPDILKIDRSIVSGLDLNPAKRAAIAALGHFAAETGATVLAEGVETEGEAKALTGLGVTLAQGWLFGRAEPLADCPTAATG